ncbi:MAG: tetratricopeptide repeat protein [Bacteroidales bacterium]|nr:tetratricopeptide repeat protein [Bacteroidales bacterium]MBN2764425.1 tetratricopeptide repeat protein [Bacteroidales bacterium]
MQTRLISVIIAIIISATLSGQQTIYHTQDNNLYQRGLELYRNGKYSAAQQIFHDLAKKRAATNTEIASRSEYYEAMCALKLFNKDAEYLVNRYIVNNVESPLTNDAYYALANYFYQSKTYGRALEYYQKTDFLQLSKDDLAEYHFKSGYCHFIKKDLDKARYAFGEIKDIDTRYTAPALYYYSHINYSQKNYETALDGFMKLRTDENFGPIVPYYITHIYFIQQRYEDVINYAPSLMQNVTEKRKAEISRIIGESYSKTGKYNEAMPYLETFYEEAKSVSKEDRYQLAYVYYKTNQFQKAAKLFGSITGEESALSQNALYHLADCYLKLNDKKSARMAFSSASKMDFDHTIKEDALFNYALVTYETSSSPFNEAIQGFNDYLSLYPSSKRSDEAYNYLVLAYLNAKNYKIALASMDKIRKKSPEINKAYQKIAYYRGLELFNDLRYDEAIQLLNLSATQGSYDPELLALSSYWKGEVCYRKNEYREALDHYSRFLAQAATAGSEEYKLTHYNTGYCYFELEQYPQALVWFKRFLPLADRNQQNVYSDALNRTADCYFIRSDYQNAITYYDQCINAKATGVDYAMYQKGLSLGILGNHGEKIQTLSRLITSFPTSALKADALYQIAESYVRSDQPDKAAVYFKQVISDFPSSSYVRKALVNLGLLYYNENRFDESVTYYKKVISDYPGTDEAQNALIGLKNVYVDMNEVDAYFNYVKGLGAMANVDAREQDSLSYISAEKLYMSGDCGRSVRSLTNYIQNHPDGSFLLNAHFYKGDCNYKLNQLEEAIQSFDYVISRPKNMFTEVALLGASRIRFSQENYAGALEYYKKLEVLAETRANILEARIGMLRCHYSLEEYQPVVETANKILLTEKLPADLERETRFKKAKSLLSLDRSMLALNEFTTVAKDVKSAEGAESKFRAAEIYFLREEYGTAEKEIIDFSEKTTPHQYWMARSFILWADIFVHRGNDFQALQTLQSIIDYYENNDDGILEMARKKHKNLTEKQALPEKTDDQQQDLEIEVK